MASPESRGDAGDLQRLISSICDFELMNYSQQKLMHCKNVWVTLTVFWSSQLHACCVRDTLQNFKGGYHSHSESECTCMRSFSLCQISISFQKAISDEVAWCFFDSTHLLLEECLGCMVVVEMPGV